MTSVSVNVNINYVVDLCHIIWATYESKLVGARGYHHHYPRRSPQSRFGKNRTITGITTPTVCMYLFNWKCELPSSLPLQYTALQM